MKIIQSNFGTIKVIDPVVPDSRTTAQGTYGKYAAQIASGGRVKYRGAGLVDHGPAGVRQGYKYAGPVKLIETFKTLMKKPNYSLDDAVAAVNKAKLKYSPDKIKAYFKNFVSDKRSMSTEQYLTYIKERIKDPSIPHKENWNKPLMGSPLEVKGFGKRKNVRVSDLIEAEKQLSDDELRLWRAYTKKQQKKVKFARSVEGERIDPVTGDVIKDPEVRSNWLAKAYIRKGIRRARKSNAYKQLSPLERLKLEFFEKRLDVMGNIIKENPALLKNKEVMKLLETGVNAKTGKIIKSPVDFSQIKDRRVWELEHIDPIKSGQTKMRGSFLSNLQVLPQSVHKNFKDPAEKFLNANWGKKEYANEINEILKQAQELKVTLRVKDVGPVGYKATFENFLDKADDVFNLYVRDSGAKKLYSETIAEMKPANIKFNWKILGFKEAPSEEIIQKAVTETTKPAFQGIKDAVLLSIPAAVATEVGEAATADAGVEKAKSWPIEHPWLTGAGATGAAATTKKGRNLLGKAFRILGTPLSGLTWAGLNVRDKLKQGESITDAIIDPLTGLELSFPALFKENVAKITKSPTFQKALTLGKFGTKVMPGLGLGLTTLSAVRGMPEEPSYIRESKQRRQAKEDYYTEGEHFAGGGLTRTVAPDSGPMSGLPSLYNRVKKQ